MKHCVRYEIYLEEPLKMGTQGSQNLTESLTYVTGSALRGAILGKFIERYCKDAVQELDTSEYADILFKNTRFFDAYPVLDGRTLLPVPFVYYADKHAVREAQKEAEQGREEGFAVHSCAKIGEAPKEGEQRVDIGKYCYMDGDVLYTVSVNREVRQHLALKSKDENQKMFGYEAIAKGQTFAGVIQCDSEEAAKKYRAVLEQNTILYLGGSRGSGYGRCSVHNVEQLTFDEVCQKAFSSRTKEKNTLLVYALSHLQLVDEWGRVTGMIAPEFLEKRLGITKVKLEQSFLSTFRTGGFNHKWQARQVQQTAVQAGSVYIYSYEGNLEESHMRALEECGIGQRKTDGFGRIILNPQLNQKMRRSRSLNTQKTEQLVLTAADKLLLNRISVSINKDREAAVLQAEAHRIAVESRNSIQQISQAEKYQLYNRLQTMFAVNTAELDEDKAKRKIANGKVKEVYQKAKVSLNGPKNIKTVLQELTDDSVTVASWSTKLAAVKKVHLSEEAQGDGTSDFVLKGRLLMEVFYNLMRMGGARE